MSRGANCRAAQVQKDYKGKAWQLDAHHNGASLDPPLDSDGATCGATVRAWWVWVGWGGACSGPLAGAGPSGEGTVAVTVGGLLVLPVPLVVLELEAGSLA